MAHQAEPEKSIMFIHPLAFTGLSILPFLDMSHNPVTTLSDMRLMNITALTALDLSHTCISEVSRQMFSYIHLLKVLDLSHNLIKLTSFKSNADSLSKFLKYLSQMKDMLSHR